DLVVEDLVGDVDPGGDTGLQRQLTGVEVRPVADVLEDVVDVGEGRLAEPLHALAAHLGDAGDLCTLAGCHRHHRVAADATAADGPLGQHRRPVVRTAAAEVGDPLGAAHGGDRQ